MQAGDWLSRVRKRKGRPGMSYSGGGAARLAPGVRISAVREVPSLPDTRAQAYEYILKRFQHGATIASEEMYLRLPREYRLIRWSPLHHHNVDEFAQRRVDALVFSGRTGPGGMDMESVRARSELKMQFPLVAEFAAHRWRQCGSNSLNPSRSPRVMSGRRTRASGRRQRGRCSHFSVVVPPGGQPYCGHRRDSARARFLSRRRRRPFAGGFRPSHRTVALPRAHRSNGFACARLPLRSSLDGRSARCSLDAWEKWPARSCWAVAKAFARALCWEPSCSNASWTRSLSSYCSLCLLL